MASSFMGLYVQRNALMIAQKSLDITGNNISNINTKGYTRQRVDVCSVGIHKNVLGYGNSVDYMGRGSDVIGVAQIRDRVLDKQVRTYSGDLCNAGVKVTTLSDIEDIFDSIEADSSENEASFAAIVNKFKAALQSYTTDHADRSEMANIAKNTAESLAQALRNYDLRLDDVAEDTLEDAKNTVKRINTILAEMGSLNKQIKDAYITMGYITTSNGNYQVQNDYGPLELKDSMNLLLDELAQYGNIEFKEESDGTFTIKFAGQLVVSEKYYAQMAMTETSPRPTEMSFIITTGEVDEDGKPINGGLYDKDQWYEMNTDNGTGGDSSFLVRGILKDKTQNITGKDVHGNNYLKSGALRGYLDMYNGRGLFAKNTDGTPAYQTIENQLNLANDAIDKLAGAASLTQEEIDECIEILRETVNAKITENDDGSYTVTVNGVTVLGTADDGTAIQDHLTYRNPDSPNRDNVVIETVNGGEEVRTIAINTYTGIEYYRDMLNAFVKTMADEFNKVYEDFGFKLFDYGDDFRNAVKNLRLTDDWLLNPELLANPSGQNEFEELDNTYLHKLLALFTNDLTYTDGYGHKIPEDFSLDKFVAYMNEEIGSKVSSETTVYDATDIQLTTAEYARSEVMDVSMDDEGINMMNYQKWYNAISRMISTLDEALDKLINQTGLVGLR